MITDFQGDQNGLEVQIAIKWRRPAAISLTVDRSTTVFLLLFYGHSLSIGVITEFRYEQNRPKVEIAVMRRHLADVTFNRLSRDGFLLAFCVGFYPVSFRSKIIHAL
jgi:hypothetical protein